MGYRSDVGLAMTKNGWRSMDIRLNEKDEHLRKEVDRLLEYAEEHYADADTEAEVWHWNWIKWYEYCEGYEYIDFIMETLRELDEGDYLFLRLGENDDDTEVMGSFWDNPFGLGIIRKISLAA